MEARWAVFMDTMRVPYHYEPEGFRLGKLYYLPDFYLPNQDAYLEIKSPECDPVDWKKINALAQESGKKVFVICGPPQLPDAEFWGQDQKGSSKAVMVIRDGEDYDFVWCECPHCHRCELQFDGRADRIGCDCPKSAHGDKGYNYDTPMLRNAYNLAKSFRFDQ